MENDQSIELDLSRSEGPDRTVGDGITVQKIREMVELFYSRTQQDEMLGPIFEEIVEDWDAHYEKMTRFWSSATMHAGTYSGRPLEAHKFGGLTSAHFDRWVELFSQTVRDLFSENDSAIFVDLGQRMATNIAMRTGAGRLEY